MPGAAALASKFEFKPPFFVGQLPQVFISGQGSTCPARGKRSTMGRTPECFLVKLATGSALLWVCIRIPIGIGERKCWGLLQKQAAYPTIPRESWGEL